MWRGWALVALCVIGCKGDGAAGVRCPDDLVPCGTGCRPSGSVCCDDGSKTTSSYCTNLAGGGCYLNDRGCEAAFPSGQQAEFCCAETGTIGSNDCPEGQRHCGLSCVLIDEPCCEGNDCRYAAEGPACPEGVVVCAYDLAADICWTCDPGYCCGGPTGPEGGCYRGGGVCEGGGGDPDPGDCPGGWLGSTRICAPGGDSCNCTGETDVCITEEAYESGTGLPFPDSCAPEGTVDCLTSDNRLAKPCCPGLTCASTSTCGQRTSGAIGECVPL